MLDTDKDKPIDMESIAPYTTPAKRIRLADSYDVATPGTANASFLGAESRPVDATPVKQKTSKQLFYGTAPPKSSVDVQEPYEWLDRCAPPLRSYTRAADKAVQGSPGAYEGVHVIGQFLEALQSSRDLLRLREEPLTFQNLQQPVQYYTRREFTEKHLRQIKYLCPEAFDWKYALAPSKENASRVEAHLTLSWTKEDIANDKRMLQMLSSALEMYQSAEQDTAKLTVPLADLPSRDDMPLAQQSIYATPKKTPRKTFDNLKALLAPRTPGSAMTPSKGSSTPGRGLFCSPAGKLATPRAQATPQRGTVMEFPSGVAVTPQSSTPSRPPAMSPPVSRSVRRVEFETPQVSRGAVQQAGTPGPIGAFPSSRARKGGLFSGVENVQKAESSVDRTSSGELEIVGDGEVSMGAWLVDASIKGIATKARRLDFDKVNAKEDEKVKKKATPAPLPLSDAAAEILEKPVIKVATPLGDANATPLPLEATLPAMLDQLVQIFTPGSPCVQPLGDIITAICKGCGDQDMGPAPPSEQVLLQQLLLMARLVSKKVPFLMRLDLIQKECPACVWFNVHADVAQAREVLVTAASKAIAHHSKAKDTLMHHMCQINSIKFGRGGHTE